MRLHNLVQAPGDGHRCRFPHSGRRTIRCLRGRINTAATSSAATIGDARGCAEDRRMRNGVVFGSGHADHKAGGLRAAPSADPEATGHTSRNIVDPLTELHS